MEVKKHLRLILLSFSFLVVHDGKTQGIDSLLNLIEANVVIDYSKDTTRRNYGSIALFNDSLCHCISYAHQPNYTKIKPVVESLILKADTADLEKLTKLTSKLIDQFNIAWESMGHVACRTLDDESTERFQLLSLITQLQCQRLYLMLLINFKGNEYKTYEELMNRLRLETFCYDFSEENRNEKEFQNCNRIKLITLKYDELLNQSSRRNKLFYQAESYKNVISLFQRNFKTWEKYLSSELKEFNLVNKLNSDSGKRDVDLRFIYKLIDLAIEFNSSVMNDFLIEKLKNPYKGFEPNFYLLSITDEPRVIPYLKQYFDTVPEFFRVDKVGGFDSYSYGPYGQHYSRIFFKEKLKEKLPKDKYLLAISAIARVADQEVVEFLKKEYGKKKDPRIKKEILSAIYQAYYRQKLANRPSKDWFNNQRNLLDAKIEKLDKTKSNE